jgi:hypothetical protein
MTHTIDEKTTKKELKEILEQLPDKRKPVDFSKYFGKLILPENFDVIEWQRRNRDDGTYKY